MHRRRMGLSILVGAAIYQPLTAQQTNTPIPIWLTKLIAKQPALSRTVVLKRIDIREVAYFM